MIQAVVKTLLTVLITTQMVAAKPEHYRFTKLPNTTIDMPSASYSGYLDITPTKRIHYVFVESFNDPTTDPVLVWFNGGPGCSSLFAFLQEHGPFKMEDGQTDLEVNPHPWTANASVLYLESPAGVGFSTVTKYEELFYSDTTTARDAMKALRIWYEQFPEFGWNQQNNSLYITGESYGGLYVPYLTWHIYLNNLKAEISKTGFETYNLKGFIVANGVTDVFSDWTQSMIENMYQFNVIPAEWYHAMRDNQCISNAYAFPKEEPSICGKYWHKINAVFNKLNPYDLIRKNYEINETKAVDQSEYGTAMLNGQQVTYKRGVYQDEYTPWLKHGLNQQSQENSFFLQKRFKLTGSMAVSDYFNNQTVRDTLNIETHDPWIQCNDTIFKNFTRQPEGSIWIYKALQHTKIRMLHFSGDTDGVVPTLGTKNWIRKLSWPVLEKWRPWYASDADDQVAGYVERYDRLDFATVKGVGHMSPQWARKRVQHLVTKWIFNEKI